MPDTDAPDEAPPSMVDWDARVARIDARPVDATAAAVRFIQLWHDEPHALRLGADELARIASHLRFFSVPAHQQVIGQDEQGNYLLIVLEGRIGVERLQAGGPRTRLAEVHPGDMIGEMSVLDAGSRFSACTTLSPCVIAVLDAPRLVGMMEAEPRLAVALLASLARRLSLRLRQMSARLSVLLAGG